MIREGATVGRYVLERALGRGGFGEVWLARDAAMARPVALKFLADAAPEDLVRFRREARIAGGLSHPAIGAVYEIGEHDGVAFIAMQYIDGLTLGVARPPQREAVRILRDAALAVHEAHEQGIIHRDLKPDNLMITADGRVFVMDFGLARQTTVDSSLSRTGTALGTPAYMPPEQARGEKADARSDVYALGATLYHLLAGRPPFDGDVMRVLMAVVDRAPAPLHGIDDALAGVVSTCLAKEPAARPQSAAALAADLTAWLEGRLKARSRAARLVRRPAFWIAAGLALSAALVWSFVRRTESATAEMQTQALARLRQTAQVCFDAAMAARRAGRLDGMEEHARRLKAACDAVPETLAEPHLLMARMLRAQRRSAAALIEAERAVACDPADLEARAERGGLLLSLYRQRLSERIREWKAARGLDSAAGTREEELETPEMEVMRRRALEDLRAVATTLATALEDACVLQRESEATRRALLEAPDHEDLAVGCALIAARAGEHARAIDVLSRAIERDAGSLALLNSRLQVYVMWAAAKEGRGESGDAERAAAIRDADACGPISDEPDHGLLEVVTMRVALAKSRSGAASTDLLAEAAARVEKALGSGPPTPMLRMVCVVAHVEWARLLPEGDPGVPARLDAASLQLDRLEQEALTPHVLTCRLRVALFRLQWSAARASESAGIIAEAKERAEEALRRFPRDEALLVERTALFRAIAYDSERRGAFDEQAYEQAARAYREALAVRALDDATRFEFVRMLLSWAGSRWNAGRAEGPLLEEAGRVIDEMLARGTKDSAAIGLRGRLGVARALQLARAGRDPADALRSAIADLDVAVEARARDLDLLSDRSSAYGTLALADSRAGRDPLPAWECADRDLTRLLEAGMLRAPQLLRRGKMRSDRAAWETRTNRNPVTSFDGAIADLEEVVKLTPANGAAWIYLGGARVNLGIWKSKNDGDPDALFQPAIEALDRAIALRRSDDAAWLYRGNGYYSWATQRERRQLDARDLYRAALADWEQAVKLNPAQEGQVARPRDFVKKKLGE